MRKYYSLLLVFTVVSLSSCLKQDPALDPAKTNNVVEIYEVVPSPTTSPADAVYSVYTKPFNIVPTDAFTITVGYSGANVAPEDITVTLGLKSGAVADYNTEQGTTYDLMPNNLYSVDSWTVVIPKGQRYATLKVTVRPNLFDLAKTYAFPISILSISSGVISSNFGTVIYAVSAKNKYDGAYHLKGHFLRTDLADYTGPFETDVEMHTTGPNSVAMYWPDFGSYYQPFANLGNLTAFSNVDPNTYFDLTTNLVTSITDYTGVLPMTPVPGANSRYDPSGTAPIIYLKYYYNTVPTNRIFSDTLTYTGPR